MSFMVHTVPFSYGALAYKHNLPQEVEKIPIQRDLKMPSFMGW